MSHKNNCNNVTLKLKEMADIYPNNIELEKNIQISKHYKVCND